MNLDSLNLGSGNWSAGNIFAGLVFSGIGFVMFTYGKREGDYQLMGFGAALMVYCYFTPSTSLTVVCGLGLLAAARFMRD